MFTMLIVRHEKTGDVLGQPLSYETKDAYLLDYHSKMKNAMNDANVLGVDVLVVDMQLNKVFEDKWIREVVLEQGE